MGLFNLSKSKGENLDNIYSSKKQFIYLRLQLYLHDIYKIISSNCSSFFCFSAYIPWHDLFCLFILFYLFLGQFFKQPGFLFID